MKKRIWGLFAFALLSAGLDNSHAWAGTKPRLYNDIVFKDPPADLNQESPSYFSSPKGRYEGVRMNHQIGESTLIWDNLLRVGRQVPIAARSHSQFSFSPDDSLILAFDDSQAMIFCPEKGKLRQTLFKTPEKQIPSRILLSAWAPDGSAVALTMGSDLLIYEVKTGKLLTAHSFENVISKILFSPRSDQVAIVFGHSVGRTSSNIPSTPRTIKIVSFYNGPIIETLSYARETDDPSFTSVNIETEEFRTEDYFPKIAYSSNGEMLAAGGLGKGGIVIWSTHMSKKLEHLFFGSEFLHHDAVLEKLEFSPDDSQIHAQYKKNVLHLDLPKNLRYSYVPPHVVADLRHTRHGSMDSIVLEEFTPRENKAFINEPKSGKKAPNRYGYTEF